jgi:hypothetical protein
MSEQPVGDKPEWGDPRASDPISGAIQLGLLAGVAFAEPTRAVACAIVLLGEAIDYAMRRYLRMKWPVTKAEVSR